MRQSFSVLIAAAALISAASGHGSKTTTAPTTVEAACSNYADLGYRCVPYFKCTNLDDIIRSGVRSGADVVAEDISNARCAYRSEKCCLLPEYATAVRSTGPTTARPSMLSSPPTILKKPSPAGPPLGSTDSLKSRECHHRENEGYKCVSYFQCDTNGFIVEDGSGLVDVRTSQIEPEMRPNCKNDKETCCRFKKFAHTFEGESSPSASATTEKVIFDRSVTESVVCDVGYRCVESARCVGGVVVSYADIAVRTSADDIGRCDGPNSVCCRLPEAEVIQPRCDSKAADGYRCVKSSQCEEGVFVADGKGQIDVRVNLAVDFSKYKCDAEGETCCLQLGSNQQPQAITPRCDSKASEGFICVPADRCEDGVIITDGRGQLDTRNDLKEISGYKCDAQGETCCLHEDFSPGSTAAVSVGGPPPLKRPPACGRRNRTEPASGENKYEGSTEFGEWPHMCAVINQTVVDKLLTNVYVCGCSIIADNTVLTAAHCVSNFEVGNMIIRAGEWDTAVVNERMDKPHQDRKVKKVTVHPLYEPTNFRYDFAVVHLDEAFEFDDHIGPICLPDAKESTASFVSKECFATGWGKDKFDRTGNYQQVLKYVELDLMPEPECESTLRGTRLGQSFTLHRTFLCAGGEEKADTCKGDGGGPLVCPRTTRANEEPSYIQVGIVAWGVGCKNPGVPGVYANVSTAVCFIDWATRCFEGPDVDKYHLGACHKWAVNEICRFREKLGHLQDELDGKESLEHEEPDFGEDFDDVEDIPETLRFRISTLKRKIERLENFVKECDKVKYEANCGK